MIGEQIRHYREEKHIKQGELAEYLGVSFQAVSKWETGASTPDIALLPKIAVFFGVSIDELFEMPYDEQMERIENMYWNERRINEKTFEKAVSWLEGVLRDHPDDERALCNIAYLYNHRAHSDHELASMYAKKAIEKDPEEKAGWVAYLEANNGLCGDEWYDNHFEIISYFKEFLQKHPDNYRCLYAIIENLLADARYEEAIPYIEQMKKVRKNHQYLLYCGDVAFGQGNQQKAMELWEQMAADYPDEWQAFCCLGEGYQKTGNYGKALEAYEKSFTMQESPRIFDGLCSMAQVYELQKDYEKAIKTWKRVIDCLKKDYGTTEGEQVDQYQREINRLTLLQSQNKRM